MTKKSKTETIIGFLIASLGNKEFCFDIKNVHAAIPKTEFETGMIFGSLEDYSILFEGKRVPIINLNRFFHNEEIDTSDSTRLIILEYESFLFAFFVDKVSEIITISKKNIEKLKMISFSTLKSYIADVINYEGRNFIIPNFKKIIAEYFNTKDHTLIINN